MLTYPDDLPPGADEYARSRCADGYDLTDVYNYIDAAGKSVFLRARYDSTSGDGKTFLQFHFNGSEYVATLPPRPAEGWPLYRLPDILHYPAEPVWLVEGEKCAVALSSNGAPGLAEAGAVATTSGASNSVARTDWRPLAGRVVLIWPDNDKPGEKWLASVENVLLAVGAAGWSCVDPARFGLPAGGDVADYIRMAEKESAVSNNSDSALDSN